MKNILERKMELGKFVINSKGEKNLPEVSEAIEEVETFYFVFDQHKKDERNWGPVAPSVLDDSEDFLGTDGFRFLEIETREEGVDSIDYKHVHRHQKRLVQKYLFPRLIQNSYVRKKLGVLYPILSRPELRQ